MNKLKKIKGDCRYITDDGTLAVSINMRNGIYVYDLQSKKQILQCKTVSHVSRVAVSKDKKLIAVKNTSGTIALISMDSGEELGRNVMQRREGYDMTFIADDKYILDFDWDGRIMLLDCATMNHSILDRGADTELPRNDYIHYDKLNNKIYSFIAYKWGDSPGEIQVSNADIENISFKKICDCENTLPYTLDGISFCQQHIYYCDSLFKKEFIVTDKYFKEQNRIPFPDDLKKYNWRSFWVSEREKYMLCYVYEERERDTSYYAILYDLSTMDRIETFEMKFVSNFRTYDEERKFVISTWEGSYLGEF